MLYQLFNLLFSGYNMFITVGNTENNRAILPDKYYIPNKKKASKRVSWNTRVFVYQAYSKKEYER